MSMLKIAGVDSNGQATAFKLDSEGRSEVVRTWSAEAVPVFANEEIRATDAVWSSRVDVAKYATLSLRVWNGLDQPVSISFGVDTGSDSITIMKNYGGSNLGFTIPVGSGVKMITPEEFPFLQYLQKIKVRAACSTAPTSGSLSISIVGRY